MKPWSGRILPGFPETTGPTEGWPGNGRLPVPVSLK